MNVRLEPGWKALLETEFTRPYFINLTDKVRLEYATHPPIYPPEADIQSFGSLPARQRTCGHSGAGSLPRTGAGRRTGFLCARWHSCTSEFAQYPPRGKQRLRASLTNTFRQPAPMGRTGCTAAKRHSYGQRRHGRFASGIGWETFTDRIIEIINRECRHVVFMLWGSYARRKGAMIDHARHCVLEAPHPSPSVHIAVSSVAAISVKPMII